MGSGRRRLIGTGTDWRTTLDEWLSRSQVDTGQQLDLSIVDAASRVPGLRRCTIGTAFVASICADLQHTGRSGAGYLSN